MMGFDDLADEQKANRRGGRESATKMEEVVVTNKSERSISRRGMLSLAAACGAAIVRSMLGAAR